jgi:predicted enzyme related to lactoylglutathione lyase
MSAKRKPTKKTAKKTAKKTSPRIAAKKSASKAARKAAKKAAPPKRSAARARKTSKPAGPQIVHWEIQSQTPEALHRFYADVFGWEVNTNNLMNYGMVSSGGAQGIDGGIGGSPSPGSRVLVYANVEDIDAILQRVESLGGKTLMPRTDVGAVIMALYTDPDGNVMGVIEG